MKYLPFVLTAVILLILDGVYLTLNRKFLETQLKMVQGSAIELKIEGMILCYVTIILGLYYFIIRQKRSVFDSFLLGLFVYGVYETTNYCTFHRWKPEMVIVDTLWGGILFAATTYFVYFFSQIM